MFPQIKSLLFPLFFLLLTSSILHSQTYFTQLADATGYADELQAHQLDSLNAAAQRLTEALPNAELQGDFGVYDMGFYRHHTTYEGGIPDVMQEAIDGLSTSYYLFFGREIGEEGELKKVWVEMELPEADFLSCLDQSQSSFHEHMASTFVNGPAIIGKNDSYLYMKQLQAAFGYLKGVLAQLEDCCDQESGFRSLESCSHCSQDVQAFRSFMEANDFIGIEVEDLVVTPYFDTTGNIREYTSATVDLEEETINVNDDVIGFLNRMDNSMDGIYGSLYYYDPLNEVICKQILEVVSGEYSLPLALQQGGVTRSASEDVVMEVTTILTVDEDGGGMMHMRIDIMEQDVIGKEIYLIAVDELSYDLPEVRDSILQFFSYCGEVLGSCFEGGELVPCSLMIIPQVTIIESHLDINGFKDLERSVVLFGQPSKLARAVCEKFILLVHPNEYTLFTYDKIFSTMSNPNQPEWSLGRYLSIVDGNFDASFIERWKAQNSEHLTAFFAFHALGHMAGIDHYQIPGGHPYSCNSFMSSGYCILTGYLAQYILRPYGIVDICNECYAEEHPEGQFFTTLNDFVKTTMSLERHYHIKGKLYERYINN